MAVLQPIWTAKPETAGRVRRRIGAVMKWAVAQGYRPDNPAADAISAALSNNTVHREHRVPLSDRALGVLDEARRELAHGRGTVFPSVTGRTQGHHPMTRLMRDLEIAAVPHGFRSSFRDWAAECREAPREVCELALAHVNSDRVEAAYRRSDLFERRCALMEQWADYVSA